MEYYNCPTLLSYSISIQLTASSLVLQTFRQMLTFKHVGSLIEFMELSICICVCKIRAQGSNNRPTFRNSFLSLSCFNQIQISVPPQDLLLKISATSWSSTGLLTDLDADLVLPYLNKNIQHRLFRLFQLQIECIKINLKLHTITADAMDTLMNFRTLSSTLP